MPVQLTETTDQIALKAAFQLHGEILRDDGFAGYDGSLDAFHCLAEECLYIVENELSVEQEMNAVANTVEWFYAIHAEISEGEREPFYYLN